MACYSVEEALLASSGSGDANAGARRIARAASLFVAGARFAFGLFLLLGARLGLRAVDVAVKALSVRVFGLRAHATRKPVLWALAAVFAVVYSRSAAGVRRLRTTRVYASAAVALVELRKARKTDDAQLYKSVGIYVYKQIVELGGLWVKTGQYAATRRDILPSALASELAPLVDRVPAPPLEGAARSRLEAELGLPPGRLVGPPDADQEIASFASFEDAAEAAASVASVHRAEMYASKSEDQGGDTVRVAVKLRRPHIAERFRDDLASLAFVVFWATRLEKDLSFLNETCADYARGVMRELDFKAEAATLEEARRAHAGVALVPAVIPTLTRPGVLVMEYVDGFRANDGDALDANGLDRSAVFRRCAAAVAHGIFVEGLFHADPHAGNLSVRPDPAAADGFEIALLDWGASCRIDDAVRLAVAGSAYATATQDAALLRSSLDALAAATGMDDSDGARETLVGFFLDLLHDAAAGRGRGAKARANARHPSPLLDTVSGLPRCLGAILRTAAMLRGLAASLDVTTSLADELLAACARGLNGAREGGAPEGADGGAGDEEPGKASRRARRWRRRSKLIRRSSSGSLFDLPALAPANRPPAGWLVVRGEAVTLAELLGKRYVDARAALRRTARVCAYHDVALIRVSPEEASDDGEDDDDDRDAFDEDDDLDDISSFDSVFDSELLKAL